MDANKENKGEKIGRRAEGFDDQALEGGTKAAPPRPALAKPDAVLTADAMGFADKGRKKIGRPGQGLYVGGTKADPPRPALAKRDAVLTADAMGFADKGQKKIGRPGQGLYVGGTKADPAVPAVVSLRWSAEWIQNRWATSSCARRR